MNMKKLIGLSDACVLQRALIIYDNIRHVCKPGEIRPNPTNPLDLLLQSAPKCMILLAKFPKFSGGSTPEPPWREGATPSLHPPPARPKAVLGVGTGRGSPPPAKVVRGLYPRKILGILQAKSCIQVHFAVANLVGSLGLD